MSKDKELETKEMAGKFYKMLYLMNKASAMGIEKTGDGIEYTGSKTAKGLRKAADHIESGSTKAKNKLYRFAESFRRRQNAYKQVVAMDAKDIDLDDIEMKEAIKIFTELTNTLKDAVDVTANKTAHAITKGKNALNDILPEQKDAVTVKAIPVTVEGSK